MESAALRHPVAERTEIGAEPLYLHLSITDPEVAHALAEAGEGRDRQELALTAAAHWHPLPQGRAGYGRRRRHPSRRRSTARFAGGSACDPSPGVGRSRAFRQSLIELYGGRCAVSESRVVPLLEAAHITPHAEGSG